MLDRTPTARGRRSPFSLEQTRALIETYRGEVHRCDPGRAAGLLHEVARLYEEELDDVQSAMAAVEEALDLDPAAPLALSTGVRLLLQSGRAQHAAALLHRGADAAQGIDARVALLHELAELQLRVGQRTEAEQTYRRILDGEEDNTVALEALLRLSLGRGDWAGAAPLCSALALAEEDPLTRCSLFIAAALLGPAAQQRRLLLLALSTGELTGFSLALLMPLCEAEQDWEHTVELLGQLPDRALLSYQIGWILAERLGRPGEAIAHAQRAIELEPDQPALWEWLRRLLRSEARWEELVSVLGRLAELAASSASVDYHLAAADLLFSRLHDGGRAIAALNDVLRIEPDNPQALQLLQAIQSREHLWDDLAQLQLARDDDSQLAEERAENLFRAAQTLGDRLDQTAEAVELLEHAIDLADHEPALRLLERLYREQGRWSDLVGLLLRRAEGAELGTQRHSLLTDVVALLEHRLGDAKRAAIVYGELIELPADPLHCLNAVVRIGESTGDATAAVNALRIMEARLDSPRQQATAAQRMAHIAEEREGDPEAALEHYRRALDLDSTLPGLHEAVQRQLVRLRRWPELVEQLERQLAQESRSERRYWLLRRVGWLQEEPVGRPGDAASSYRQALAVAGEARQREVPLQGLLRVLPPDDLHRLPPPDQLEQLRGARLAAAGLLRLVQQLLERGDVGNAEQLDRARELAELALRLDPHGDLARYLRLRCLVQQGGLEVAASMLPPLCGALLTLRQPERALQLLGDHLDESRQPAPLAVARWLELLATARGRETLELKAVALRAEAEPDARRRCEVRCRLASLVESRGDGTDPVQVYRAILDDDPGEERALRALERLARRNGDDALLLEALQGRARVATAGERSALIATRAGMLLRLGRDDEAVAQWRRALEEDPGCRQAYDALRCLFWEQGESDGLSWTLERGLDAVAHPRAVTGDLLQRAKFREERGDLAGALHDLDRLLELAPGHPEAVEHQLLLLRGQDDDEALASRLEQAARHTAAPRRRASLLLQLAELQLDRFDDPQAARQTLAHAIAADPESVEALMQAAQLHLGLDQPTEAMALLNRALLRAEGEQWLQAQLQLARVCGEVLGDARQARASLEAVLELEPDHQEATALMVRLAMPGPDRQPAVEEPVVKQRPAPQALPRPSGTLSAEQVHQLALPEGDHPLRELLALLRDHLPMLLPPDLGHYNIESVEGARLAADHPAWDVASVCSGVLKLGYFELAGAAGGAPHGACLPGAPPVLLLPESFLQLPLPDQLFLCGRLLARIAVGTEALDPGRRPLVRVRDLDLLQAALQHGSGHRLAGEPAPGPLVDDMGRRLSQRLSADELQHARELAAQATAPKHRERWTAWLRSTELGACRSGLLCAGDLNALDPLWNRPGGPLTDHRSEELTRFSHSPEYAEYRQRLGLAPPQ